MERKSTLLSYLFLGSFFLFIKILPENLAPEETVDQEQVLQDQENNQDFLPQEFRDQNLKDNNSQDNFNKKVTALHLQYQKEREKFNILSKKQKEREKNKNNSRTIIPPDPTKKRTEYTDIRNIDLSGLTGNVILTGTSGDKFSVDAAGADVLNLTLKEGSNLNIKNEVVTLRDGDIINIVGKNNTFYISNTFIVEGDLLFDTDSQLTINFITDDAQFVLSESNIIDLESNVEFKFIGQGVVLLKNNATINLKGATANPELYPSFILQDYATLNVDASSTGLIKGVGKVIAQNGGIIDIRGYSNTKHLNFGNSVNDDIELYVRGKAMLRVDGGVTPYRAHPYSTVPPTGNYGSISFGTGKFSLFFRQGGIMYIGPGGWIEFNSNLAVPTDMGHLKKIDFGPDGCFDLQTGGYLSFADNDYSASVELNTIWIADDSVVFGDNGGQVEYVCAAPLCGATYQGFIGTFSPTGFMFKDIVGLTPKEISRKLIT
ncbi:MAG: hypothetical protein SZ59_C0004G0091 [candidate division TM6 bacterium GW2011_GWF2_28_16]|nr:MAG: hypothetical protein SZ59_C0004G0091 [candidate division TM6 bacterium GW2011_GWF2_28_16]